MRTLPKPSTVVFAKDIDRLARFYAGVAGMATTHTDTDHVVLDHPDFQFVVHGIPPAIAERVHITTPPQLREDTPIKPCLPVASLADARGRAAQLGGQLGAPGKEWAARGFRACDGHDPEGNVFQLRESAP